ncbi:hypothetical protein [Micromonospora sediminicola]|uniref:hypothetical protein n=1 Tax=Micromonospora sediminicola TaxID=946078 RepID=UPI0037BDB06E
MGSLSFRLRTAVIALVAAVGVLPAATASATPSAATSSTHVSYEDAVPGLAPADAAGVYLDAQGRQIPQPGTDAAAATSSAQAAALGCTPESGRDNPHYSSGDVSGHGWWKKGTCTASTAHVYNCLYEWYTDATWRQKACSPTKQLRPYTGSGDRTVARATCNSTSQTISWRNHVDVDVDGQIDTGEQPYNQANVACVVN